MVGEIFQTIDMAVIGFVYTLLVIIFFFMKGKKDRLAGKIYLILMILSLISMSLYIVSGVMASFDIIKANTMGKITCISIIFWLYVFMYYLFLGFKTDEENVDFFNKYGKYIVIGLLIGCPILNIVTYQIYDANYVQLAQNTGYILRGDLVNYVNFLYSMAIGQLLLSFMWYRKKMNKTAKILGGIISVISIISLASNFLLNQQVDICFLQSLIIVFLYLSVESQDAAVLEEFKKSTQQAQETSQLKSDFIMNMSHQLRTPMNTILGFSELLLTTDNLTAEILKDDTKNIKTASRNLLELINSILDISKLESDKETLNLDNYCLDSIIYDISSNINSKISKENLIFTINADENCPNDLYGDGFKLCKILSIILINAINHTNYGEVSLNVSTKKIDTANHELTFRIANTGHAMKVEDFDKTFDDLVKLTSYSEDKIDSETLNLIVAKGLIEIISGSIEFINEKGKGTQYIIKIKQKVTTQNILGNVREKIQTRHAITHQLVNLLGKKALIIDDKKINTIILQRLLPQYNIKIDTSLNPREGVDLAVNNEYDIIFVDHEMDDLSGQEVADKLIATGNKLPPIIGLITKTSELSIDNDYDATLECPIEFRDLNKLMNRMFNEKE